jgi:ribosome-associated protein
VRQADGVVALRPAPGVSIPLDEIVVRTSRSGGPGGQHANVTASRVEVVFDAAASPSLTEEQRRRVVARCGGAVVRAIAQDTRSQTRNREVALERLERRLAAALKVARPRQATKPTRGSKERRLQAKRRQSERKSDRRRPDD